MPLWKGPQRDLNGAEDSIHHKTTNAMMEQITGNMVFTQLECHASSDKSPLTKYVGTTTEKKSSSTSHSPTFPQKRPSLIHDYIIVSVYKKHFWLDIFIAGLSHQDFQSYFLNFFTYLYQSMWAEIKTSNFPFTLSPWKRDKLNKLRIYQKDPEDLNGVGFVMVGKGREVVSIQGGFTWPVFFLMASRARWNQG